MYRLSAQYLLRMDVIIEDVEPCICRDNELIIEIDLVTIYIVFFYKC